jgi:two-component system response regulator YesN
MLMYNILVVDDESISADGITDYLKEFGSEEWNILCTYSSQQALEIADNRIDILLTDITMPNIDGYELYRRIIKRWPRCKVIYLTGNVSLEFVQKAIRNRGVIDYILKTEKESNILKAVNSAIETLEDEIKSFEFQDNMKKQIDNALPLLRREYLLNLLYSANTSWNRKTKFSDLEIGLDDEKEVLLVYGRLETAENRQNQTMDLIYMDTIMQITLNNEFCWNLVQMENSRFIYYIQTKNSLEKGEQGKIAKILLPYMELVQESINRISINISLILDVRTCSWEQIPGRYKALAEQFERKPLLPNALFIYDDDDVSETASWNLADVVSSLKDAIFNLKKDEADIILQNILNQDFHNFMDRVRVYAALIDLFSNLLSVKKSIPDDISFPPLEHESDDDGWNRAKKDFFRILAFLTNKEKTKDIIVNFQIQKINKFVEDRLDKNLSLTMVADHFHYSPTYFSKLYKHITGENFVRHVVKCKLKRGMELLNDDSLKINEIAKMVGYWSPSYFIREFKSMYGITPAEYRKG